MNPSLFDCLLLNRLPGIGSSTWSALMTQFTSVRQLLATDPENLPIGDSAKRLLHAYQNYGENSDIAKTISAELSWCEAQGVTLLSLCDESYPELLRQIHRPPPILYVLGDGTQLHRPQIAVVGSRKPSPGGLENAHAFSQFLASSGFTVTSGLALGVDGAAHKGALKAGGNTVAVLGCGIDCIYPYRHRALSEEILQKGGAIISEFPVGTAPGPDLFPQRNRIISGLSLGVLVVEGALRSGSLITAREGMQQGREVFVIPGSIHNPQSKGCHKLIKEGATLVESGQDMVDELQGLMALKSAELARLPQLSLFADDNPDTRPEQVREFGSKSVPKQIQKELPMGPLEPLTGVEQNVLSLLGFDPVTMDTLLHRTQLSASELGVHLMSLELKACLKQTPYGYERLRSSV